MKKFLTLIALTFSILTANAQFAKFDTECLGVEGDGSQTVRAWGTGRNRSDAVEQAKKNAVSDILFKGVRGGSQECNLKPLVPEVNARERYEEYFDRFFMDGGEYTKFVSAADEKLFSKNKQKNKIGAYFGVTVRVLRSELRAQLKADGVIK